MSLNEINHPDRRASLTLQFEDDGGIAALCGPVIIEVVPGIFLRGKRPVARCLNSDFSVKGDAGIMIDCALKSLPILLDRKRRLSARFPGDQCKIGQD